MDLRQLRYLLVVAESGSLTQASERIPIAQSALSRHIRLLEDELGVKLLIRTGRGVELTEQGDFFVGRVRSVLEQLEDARRGLIAWNDNPAGLVRIGMPPTTTLVMAADILERLKHRYPDISVRLSEGLSATLAEWLGNDRLDLAVVFDHSGKSPLRAEPIARETLCFAVPCGATCPDPVTIEDMASHRLIAPFRKQGIRNRMAAAFEQAGFEFRAAYELDSLPAIKALVRSGAGAAILSRSSIKKDVVAGRLESRRIDAPNLMFDVHVVMSRTAEHSRAAQAAGEVIREVSAEHFA
ncbi:MAG: LysR family transcriptional regulator [Pseudomonadota bacterium]